MNEIYKCLIIDDEPIAIRVIKNHLSAFPNFSVEAECSHAIEAMPILSRSKIDLVFCDIQMPQLTGIDFIKSLTHHPDVIFTTAHRDFAVEAFDLNVVDYLLKPISFERFAKAINKFMEKNSAPMLSGQTQPTSDNRQYFFVKADKKQHKVNFDDIVYIESLGDYVTIHTCSEKITAKERLSIIEEGLPSARFLRIHRSFIVSAEKISAVGPGFAEVGKTKIPIGRLYKNNIGKLLGEK
jgi:DNA-binding LytR/AlgR family response regulator